VTLADDPLTVLLWLLARDVVPWGALDQAVHRATGEVAPDLDPNDPLVIWAERLADSLRRQS
jgi:hypothetical protein